MSPALLADITVTVHALFIGFVVLGQLLIVVGWLLGWRWIRSPWFRLAHLAAIAIVVAQILVGVQCFLTQWEKDWRIAAGLDWYDPNRVGWSPVGAFFHNLVIFENVPFDHWAFRVGYITFGLIIAVTLLMAPPRFRRSEEARR